MIYGYDPYNSADAKLVGAQVVRAYQGPLTAVAFRSQALWDLPPASCQDRYAAWVTAKRAK